MAPSKKSKKVTSTVQPKTHLSQTDVPKHRLEKALDVPNALWDNFAGHPTSPIQVASALDISPTSSQWQELPGAAVAYGLTTGSYNAQQIALTELGKRIIAPTVENDDKIAIVDALLKPRILREFYTRYNRAKFPKDTIAINILIEMGVPSPKAQVVLNIIKENGKFAGILKEIKGNQYIILDNSTGIDRKNDSGNQDESPEDISTEDPAEASLPKIIRKKDNKQGQPDAVIAGTLETIQDKARVFISHGKNKKIVEQLKEILKFGQFEIVVSIEKESTAIAVPEKVFSDMRQCDAAVIHIEGEETFMDAKGQEHKKINENVLIEIGAAMALYGKNFVLLCEKSLALPSNLQGIYRCEYEGAELNYESTIKLLKTFNEFRKG